METASAKKYDQIATKDTVPNMVVCSFYSGELPHARNRQSLVPIPGRKGLALMFGGNHFDSQKRKDKFFDEFWTMDVSGTGMREGFCWEFETDPLNLQSRTASCGKRSRLQVTARHLATEGIS